MARYVSIAVLLSLCLYFVFSSWDSDFSILIDRKTKKKYYF